MAADLPETQPSVRTSADAAYTGQLRATARWLVGASASIATVLVAGLQLRSLSAAAEAGWWGIPGALCGVLVALVTAAVLLYQAASVLATPRRTISDLVGLDRNDNPNYPGPRTAAPTNALVNDLVVRRRTELLEPHRDSLEDLTNSHTLTRRALVSGKKTKIEGRLYNPRDAADVVALTALHTDLDQRILRVVDAAEAWETWKRYQQLRRTLLWVLLPFLVGVLSFTYLTSHQLAPVKDPIPVRVTASSNASMACADKTLTGTAVGGTLDAPIVAIPAQQGCPPQKLTDTHNLIVVPEPNG